MDAAEEQMGANQEQAAALTFSRRGVHTPKYGWSVEPRPISLGFHVAVWIGYRCLSHVSRWRIDVFKF